MTSMNWEEKLHAKFLEWSHERLQYSQKFQKYDSDGEIQTNTEGYLAANLFDEWHSYTLIEHAMWAMRFVANDFKLIDMCYNVETMIELVEDLCCYLSLWVEAIVDIGEGPDETEAAQAGRDMLLIMLRYLIPEFVVVEKVGEDE